MYATWYGSSAPAAAAGTVAREPTNYYSVTNTRSLTTATFSPF
jgi:hypothetical protein